MVGHQQFINGFAMTKDGKRAVTGSDDNTIRVWDLGTGQEIARFQHNTQVWPVAISNDGKKVVSAGLDSNVRVWDVDKKVEIRKLEHPTRVWSMAFSPDGKVLVCGTGGQVNQIPKNINFGPNPPQFNQNDNALYFWEFESGKFLRRLTGPNGYVRALVWTPDGQYLVSGGQDNTIRVWGAGKKGK
jgi:WD40 repeat protein